MYYQLLKKIVRFFFAPTKKYEILVEKQCCKFNGVKKGSINVSYNIK